MKINPTQNNIVISLNKLEKVSEFGIVLALSEDTSTDTGTVLEVGPGIKDENGSLIPMEVKVGDIVVFKQFTGQQIKIAGKELLVLKEQDILAILEE